MLIRPETAADYEGIRLVTTEAFERSDEADLIEALRQHDRVVLSLVALVDDCIVGHVLFFPLVIETEFGNIAALGLGPMSVLPRFQRQGVGSMLVTAGLAELRKGTNAGIIVLGHPEFYSRFGFAPASRFGITTRYDVPDEVFMALELTSDGLRSRSGAVVYPQEFDGI